MVMVVLRWQQQAARIPQLLESPTAHCAVSGEASLRIKKKTELNIIGRKKIERRQPGQLALGTQAVET